MCACLSVRVWGVGGAGRSTSFTVSDSLCAVVDIFMRSTSRGETETASSSGELKTLGGEVEVCAADHLREGEKQKD